MSLVEPSWRARRVTASERGHCSFKRSNTAQQFGVSNDERHVPTQVSLAALREGSRTLLSPRVLLVRESLHDLRHGGLREAALDNVEVALLLQQVRMLWRRHIERNHVTGVSSELVLAITPLREEEGKGTVLVGLVRLHAVDDLLEWMELLTQLIQLVIHDVKTVGGDEVRGDAGPPAHVIHNSHVS
jgi:hypothetical protein